MASKKLEILAISGARAGSKGLPGKNIKKLNGKPLLAWPIEIANRSKYINRCILSTDSPHYAKIAKKYKAEVPFLRPKKLARDTSVVFEYIKHALNWLKSKEKYEPDIVVYLCPTVPMIDHKDIDKAIELLIKNPNAHSVVLVSNVKGHPMKMLKPHPKNKNYVLSYIDGRGQSGAPSNRQAYEKAYNRESLPVISRLRTIKRYNSQTGKKVLYHEISEESAYDIDTELDFYIVEQLLKRKKK